MCPRLPKRAGPVCSLLWLSISLTAQGQPQLPGWPIHITYDFGGTTYRPWITKAPAVADIDNDTYSEIVVLGNIGCTPGDFIGVYRYDGTPQEGWPKHIAGGLFSTDLAVGNLDAEPDLEIVAVSLGVAGFGCGQSVSKVFVWKPNGDPLPGWPKSYGAGEAQMGLELVDLSNDGHLDIVLTTRNSAGVKIYAWDGSGTELPGWPVTLPYPHHFGQSRHAQVVVGDVNGDGFNEVIVPLNSGTTATDSQIAVLSHTGELLTSWSLPGASQVHDPVLGDLDGDGVLDIIAGVTTSTGGQVYAFDSAGTVLSGWPRDTGREPQFIALGNLDSGGGPAVFVATNDQSVVAANSVTGFDRNGNTLAGWPVAFNPGSIGTRQGPVIGDVDGDGTPEILAVEQYFFYEPLFMGLLYLYAWQPDGTPSTGYPFLLSDLATANGWGGAPTLVDLNNDGLVDMVVPEGASNVLNAFALPGPYDPQQLPWPMFRQNPQRSAVYLPSTLHEVQR